MTQNLNNPFELKKDERVGVFIDGANFFKTQRELHFIFDYSKLISHLKNRCNFMFAYYYVAYGIQNGEFTNIKLRGLIDYLDYNGYRLVTKPIKYFRNLNGDDEATKGDLNVELVVDMMSMKNFYEHALIFSGDGDFKRLIDALQREGKKITVVSTARTHPPILSDDLKRQCDTFIELEELKTLFSKTTTYDSFSESDDISDGDGFNR